jgi:hypothetical protein
VIITFRLKKILRNEIEVMMDSKYSFEN